MVHAGEASRSVNYAEPEHARLSVRGERARPLHRQLKRFETRGRARGGARQSLDARGLHVAEELERDVKLLGLLPRRAHARKLRAKSAHAFAHARAQLVGQLDRAEDSQGVWGFVRHVSFVPQCRGSMTMRRGSVISSIA